MLSFPDGMRYVGLAKSLGSRMEGHKTVRKETRLQEWKDEYGWDAVTITVLERPPVDWLAVRERVQIRKQGTRWPKGLNMTSGGEVPDAEAVRASWRNPQVRARHVQARKDAWANPLKRANILKGRKRSAKVEAAKRAGRANAPEANAKRTVTWEAKREARLAGLTGKEREQRLARLNRDREKKRRSVAAKRNAPDPPASSAKTGARASEASGYETGSDA